MHGAVTSDVWPPITAQPMNVEPYVCPDGADAALMHRVEFPICLPTAIQYF